MSSQKRAALEGLEETEVRPVELGYVTSIDKKNRTFFAQLCKFTNKDLVEFNLEIHNHCCKLNNWDLSRGSERDIVVGGIYCARYSADRSWYRVKVMSKVLGASSSSSSFQCVFVDYGNIETFSRNELVKVDPRDLNCIHRAPFGIVCYLNDSEKLDEATANIMLEASFEEYILLQSKEKLGPLEWVVDLPRVAYNSSFWFSYHSNKNKLLTGRDAPLEESVVNQRLLSREEMLAAGLTA